MNRSDPILYIISAETPTVRCIRTRTARLAPVNLLANKMISPQLPREIYCDYVIRSRHCTYKSNHHNSEISRRNRTAWLCNVCTSTLGSTKRLYSRVMGLIQNRRLCFQMFPRGLMSLNKEYKRQWKAWWFASSAPITISSVPGCPKSLSISPVDFPTNLSKDNFF